MDLHHLLLAGLPAHSGLPRSTDILAVGRHVSNVPTNGLMHRNKRHLYSITLSARPSSEGGTARPSALAVLRLTISSDFVGACTHLGLPYESHRLQAPDRKGSTSEVQQ